MEKSERFLYILLASAVLLSVVGLLFSLIPISGGV